MLPLGNLLFSEGKWWGSESVGEESWGELVGVEGAGTVVRMYCMRVESILNNKKVLI